MSTQSEIGSVVWTDLTIPDAGKVRDFYAAVVGWKHEPVEVGGYSDFTMLSPSTGKAVTGICHARGMNANLPAQWLIYITVADIKESVEQCSVRGGKVLIAPKSMGEHGTYCVIQDPAGAVAALIQPAQ